MSRVAFTIEKGLHVTGENSNVGVHYLFGSGAPGGDSGPLDAAEVGSLYQRTDTPSMYIKIASANATSDWLRIATLSDIYALSWRSEKVIAVTADAAPSEGGTIDLSLNPFSDDNAPTLAGADFVVGNYVIFGYGGTVKLMKVTNIAGDVLTFNEEIANPLADNDAFLVRYFLPDGPDAQEKQAIVTYNGTSLIKIADFNWDLATGINISGGYNGSGTNALPASGDTVEVAIQKLDANQRDLTTLSGESIGAVNHGTFSGYTIPDNQTTKQALQALETGLEARAFLAAITTIQTVDSVVVDDVLACEWEVHIREDATPANIVVMKVLATHDGTVSADAVNVDNTEFAKLKLGANFNYSVSVDLNGTAGAQVMRLRVASTSAGVTVTTRRVIIR